MSNPAIVTGPGGPPATDVHLGTGQVRFAVPLASVSAGPSVRHDVALHYSSVGVREVAETWNYDAPTGMVGLGWHLGEHRVLSAPSSSASDRTFVLILEGAVYPLVKTGTDADGDIYTSQAYEYWIIRYQAASERWLVIKENGVRYVFGGSSGDSVEWAVRRGDWIGDSPSGGQSRVAMIWNLSAQEDPWSNRLEYSYDQTQAYSGSFGSSRQTYTVSSRLSRIRSSEGPSVALVYQEKDSSEYVKPHCTKSPESICCLRVSFIGRGLWDPPAGWPDPHIQIWVDDAKVFDRSYNDKKEVRFSVPLPITSGDIVKVRFKAVDVDPISDDLMMDTSFDLEYNAGIRTFSRGNSAQRATLEMEYVRVDLTPGGPDAYQDRYESKYLSEVLQCDASGATLVRTALEFDKLGEGSLTKRLLVKLCRTNASGTLYEPPEEFRYNTPRIESAPDPLEGMKGLIESRTLASGARISYDYSILPLEDVDLDMEIARPDATWSNPRTYIAPDYTVVIWEGTGANANKAHVSVVAWVGYWAVTTVGVLAIAAATDGERLMVRLGYGFVAIGIPKMPGALYLIAQNPVDPGTWVGRMMLSNQRYASVTPLLEVGGGIAAFLDPSSGSLSIFERAGTSWVLHTEQLRYETNAAYGLAAIQSRVFAISASRVNNYQPQAYLIQRRSAFSWSRQQTTVDAFWSNARDINQQGFTHIHRKTLICQASETFVAVQAVHTADEKGPRTGGYNAYYRHLAFHLDNGALHWERLGDQLAFADPGLFPTVVLTTMADVVSVDVVYSGLIGSLRPDSTKTLWRRTGNGWHQVVLSTDDIEYAWRGEDACTTAKNGMAQYQQFDPNRLQWTPHMPTYPDSSPTLFERAWPLVSLVGEIITLPLSGWAGEAIDLGMLVIDLAMSQFYLKGAATAGTGRYVTANNNVYWQNEYGEWNHIGQLQVQTSSKEPFSPITTLRSFAEQSTQNASRYVLYAVHVEQWSSSPNGSYSRTGMWREPRIQFLRNAKLWGPSHRVMLPSFRNLSINHRAGCIGPRSFVAYSGNDLASATSLHIFRIEHDRFHGQQDAFVVRRVRVDDGYRSLDTVLEYQTTDAQPLGGGIAQFAKVTSRPIGAWQWRDKSNNGTTESWFHARRPTTAPTWSPDALATLQNYSSLYGGLQYATRVCAPDGTEITRQTQAWNVYTVTVASHVACYFVRPTVWCEYAGITSSQIIDAFSTASKGLLQQRTIRNIDLHKHDWDVVTTTTYAFSQPSGGADFLTLNLLNAMYEEKKTIGNQPTEITAVTWRKLEDRLSPSLGRSYPVVAPFKVNRAIDPTATTVDTTKWVETDSFNQWTSTGALVEMSSRSLVQSMVYDVSGRFVLATFENASAPQRQAGYYGFAANEDPTPWVIGDGQVTARSFQPRQVAYVVSAYILPNVTGDCGSIGFGASKRTTLTGTAGVWQYVEYTTEAPTSADLPGIVCNGVVRDFRFFPIDAKAKAFTHDPSTGRLVSSIDENGLKREYHEDERLLPVAEVEPDGTVHRMFWRVDGMPRQNVEVANRSGGAYLKTAPSVDVRVAQSQGAAILRMQTAQAIATGAAVTVGMRIGSIDARFDLGNVVFTDAGVSVKSFAPLQPFTRWTMAAIGTQVWLWLDDSLVVQYTASGTITGSMDVFVGGSQASTYWPRNIYAGLDPVITMVWSDGLGRAIQTQTLNDDATGLVVTQTIYDGWGNAAIVTKPMLDANVCWGYRPNCVTALDVDGRMQGEVVDYYQRTLGPASDDSSYPYVRTLAESNPLGRTIAQGLPGKDFLVDSVNATRWDYSYNNDVAVLCSALHTDARYRLSWETMYAPGGVPTVSLFDRVGTCVAKSVGSGSTETIETVQWSYAAGLRTRTWLPPVAHQHSNTTTLCETIEQQNMLGHPTLRTTADAGTTNLLCDAAGRLRFVQGTVQAGAVVCRKYDPLGRLLEAGLLSGVAWDSLPAYVEDPNYPSSTTPGYVCRERYTYDAVGVPNSKQRLCSVARSAEDGSGELEETFVHDRYGRVVQSTAAVEGGVYTTAYSYDLFGNPTSITYPHVQGTEPDVVTYSYNRIGRVEAVGVPERPRQYGAYTYDIEGRIIRVLVGPHERTHTYDFQGQLTQIEQRIGDRVLFREDIAYRDASGRWLAGRIAQATFSGEAVSTPHSYLYAYDDRGWLRYATTTAVPSLGIAAQPAFDICNAATPMSYDPNGNILAMTSARGARVTTYTSGTNRIATFTLDGHPQTYRYAVHGALTDSPTVSGITYDPFDNMPRGYTVNGNVVRLEYDAMRARVLKRVQDSSLLYLRGAGRKVLTEQEGGRRRSYVRGPDGLVGTLEETPDFMVRDHLGSTRAIIDVNGVVMKCFSYDPFGRLLEMPQTLGRDRYLYTGQEYEFDTGLSNYGLRIYDPDIAAFYDTDPVDDDYSPYTYVRNDPVNLIDPTGAVARTFVARRFKILSDTSRSTEHLIIFAHGNWYEKANFVVGEGQTLLYYVPHKHVYKMERTAMEWVREGGYVIHESLEAGTTSYNYRLGKAIDRDINYETLRAEVTQFRRVPTEYEVGKFVGPYDVLSIRRRPLIPGYVRLSSVLKHQAVREYKYVHMMFCRVDPKVPREEWPASRPQYAPGFGPLPARTKSNT